MFPASGVGSFGMNTTSGDESLLFCRNLEGCFELEVSNLDLRFIFVPRISTRLLSQLEHDVFGQGTSKPFLMIF